MESVEHLLGRIRLGEDTALELKEAVVTGGRLRSPKRDALADELAALANGRGGTLVLGVRDADRDIVGIPLGDLDAVETAVREACNDVIDPPLDADLRRRELPDHAGQMVAVLQVDVPRSLFVHRSPGGYLTRLGSSKRALRPEQLARLFQQRSQARLIRFDEQAVPRAAPSDIDTALVSRFLRPGTDALEGARKLKVLTQDDEGDERPSVAGVLLCAERPERWLSGAWLQAVAYRGTRQDSNYQRDAADFGGPLDAQILGALRFVDRNQRIHATKAPGRVDAPQFDRRAVFEALVNAAAHRDYSVHGSHIRLHVFDDRLVLYSPGALPNTLTVDSMALRQSTRNELIASLLARLELPADADVGRGRFMDRRGDGVPIILDESTRLSGRAPDYTVLDDAEVMLTIWGAAAPS
ncbi:MAG: putative DNA binding domain-containing protein [Myxococcales bacterium]|nr:putative DNA binding domain-containing protein [Myxococcales bacterium]MCB9536754.1 putative DNA binding domain-containing protein [Myxococcales bacterium]